MQIEHAVLAVMAMLLASAGVDNWSDDRKAESLSESCYTHMGEALVKAPNEAAQKTVQDVFHCDKVSE